MYSTHTSLVFQTPSSMVTKKLQMVPLLQLTAVLLQVLVSIQTTQGGHVHTFPYETEDPVAPQRKSDVAIPPACKGGLPVSKGSFAVCLL